MTDNKVFGLNHLRFINNRPLKRTTIYWKFDF